MVLEEQCKLIQEGRDFYKGVAFRHLTFECWTSRLGFPFLGLDNTFATPWRLSRECIDAPFEGPDCAMMSTPLKHLTGRHTGERIAGAVSVMLVPYSTVSKRIVIRADSYEADISDEFATMTTDSGGGVPAACHRLGRKQKPCGLHSYDTVLSRAREGQGAVQEGIRACGLLSSRGLCAARRRAQASAARPGRHREGGQAVRRAGR